MSKLFYIASSLNNAEQVNAVSVELESYGWERTYVWSSAAALSSPEKGQVVETELNGVLDADVVVVLLPGGRGTHIEMGAALGHDVPVLLLHHGDDDLVGKHGYECVFYYHPLVTQHLIHGNFAQDKEAIALVASKMDELVDDLTDWVEE